LDTQAALEAYLASLISLPVKNKDEIIAFLTSDQIKATQKPVYQEGYKEGYLTKRGKNFGGWKTRYFVLQGPTLEYYESRGGAHLGSIAITGAQIGRQQQRAPERGPADDDNDYRHAFLVIEARKGPSASTRHVLCAENDEERDSWVGVLVRYVNGAYNAELGESLPDQQFQQYQAQEQPQAQSQSKSSFEQTSPVQRRPPPRGPSKDDGATQPTLTALVPPTGPGQSQPSPMLSSAMSPSSGPGDGGIPQQQSYDPALPSSLPAGSPLDEVPVGQRSQSELGWYGVQAPDRQPAYVPRDQRQQMQPNSQAIPEEGERPHTPENQTQGSGSGGGAIAAAIASATSAAGATTPAPGQKGDTSASASASKPKISGPLKGGIIPHGFNFGVKDPVPAPAPAPAAPTPNDRREKTKSRSFWGFGKSNAGGAPDKGAPPPMPSVPVFGVSIEDSLSVSQIAGLPAVVFRAIQYLEAKDADQEEGIYRLSGSTAVIKGLKDRFNMGWSSFVSMAS
jgi:RalA-binding protein 1